MIAHPFQPSWDRTRVHLAAARTHLAALPDIDFETYDEFLDHNELGLAFDELVHLGHELELPAAFWLALDQAAREMRLYSGVVHTPHLTAADLCRRHVAAASEVDESPVL